MEPGEPLCSDAAGSRISTTVKDLPDVDVVPLRKHSLDVRTEPLAKANWLEQGTRAHRGASTHYCRPQSPDGCLPARNSQLRHM